MKYYYEITHGLIYVIDSCDRSQMKIAKKFFYQIIIHEFMLEKPILILATKQDLPNTISIFEIAKIFNLNELHREWLLLPISRYSKKYIDGLKWIISKMERFW
ncbi:adp-ribosylation factor-related protein [Anaeramoeba flamelloides]|uniref:Adp-ribosylation factor-related protein n=1 Tax=Anaeramoeba flamelloides TaxID=1746091 RepID=A0AAV7ZVU3_9EUKA|nr:adp-ribosylation factor-related protein [Anaeramoeba flamelloides]